MKQAESKFGRQFLDEGNSARKRAELLGAAVSRRISDVMRQKGVSESEAAGHIGISVQEFRGKTSAVTFAAVYAIAEVAYALGITPDELFVFSDEEEELVQRCISVRCCFAL